MRVMTTVTATVDASPTSKRTCWPTPPATLTLADATIDLAFVPGRWSRIPTLSRGLRLMHHADLLGEDRWIGSGQGTHLLLTDVRRCFPALGDFACHEWNEYGLNCEVLAFRNNNEDTVGQEYNTQLREERLGFGPRLRRNDHDFLWRVEVVVHCQKHLRQGCRSSLQDITERMEGFLRAHPVAIFCGEFVQT